VAKARTTAFTETGVTKGKCAYMSPEQCLGEQLHRASDIFSLGATYYELVVGQPLFACETDYMTQRAVIEAPIPSPRELRPDLPPEIAAVIARALQRDPEQRFRTAAELGATLRMVLEQLGALPSQRRLAGYIQEACAGLLEGQARAIQRLDVQTRVDARMPGAEEREGEAPSSCRAGAGPAPNDVLAIGAALAEPSSASAPTPAGTTANRLQHRARRRRRLALALLVTFLAAMGIGWLVRQLLPPPPPLRLGLSPEFTRAAIGAELAPFTSYLERRLGRRLEIVVDRGYDDLRMDLVRGELDLAALPHLQVIHARRGPVPPRIVAVMSYRGQTTYRSVFVTRDNSPARSLADLRGKRACWVSRGSASGFLMPRQALREQGYDPEAFFSAVRFSGSHPAALEDVIEGRCDVTATSEGWMQMAPKRSIATIRLRVLAEAGRIPLDHICVKRQLPRALREDLRRALLEFEPRRDIERDVIGEHFLSDGFAEPRPREFAAITRAMRREGILPAE